MTRTPDPMSMLEVAEQSRQDAMARRAFEVFEILEFFKDLEEAK